ncbi:sodium-translocating pyrophosphatase, partial [Actinokineospora sp. PR83]|uniref:sodium-translocating pyrophosphatase n=1 Tax=Actinokineospora sp. PR83 TaxID=2884908 RepID=UPI001F425B38
MSGQSLAADLTLTGGDRGVVVVVAVIALAALAVGYVLIKEVLAAGQGTLKMQDIAKAVQEGAAAYLKRQRNTLLVFGTVVFLLLFLLPADSGGERIGRSLFFLVGAVFSFAIGYLGMWLATQANLRVAAAANEQGGRETATRIAFRTGGAVGMATVGLGLFGAAIVVLVYTGTAPKVLEGFGFGAALIAMFMRVGGGIFTKAADVGADLVGKVEQGIPEDDPRNAATIADNVGDNVGDCAGMAADLFESYAVTLVAALILGSTAFGSKGLLFPLIVPALGVITAMLGVYITKAKAGESGLTTINRSFYISALVSAVLCTAAAFVFLPSSFSALTDGTQASTPGNPALIAAVAVIIGIVLAGVILWLTGYYTGTEYKPVKEVGKTSLTGAATVVLSGISVGFESAVYTALVIGAAVYGAFLLSGSVVVALFAIALAGCGLLTTVGVIVAMDTFGPVSDNAQGIAEMSGDVTDDGAKILTELDAVGNTTKAITKGIAIATAVLAATALFGSYQDAIGKALVKAGETFDPTAFLVFSPDVLVGVLIGAAVVFMFSGLAINAVTRAAGAIVFEVRRQFREIPGIMEGTGKPEYGKVVDICTRDSLRELATPGLLAVLAPIAVGFGLGVGPLAGYLGGAIATGTLMAVFLANSGGAWDNAKKLVEDGNHGGKGSEAHAATVIGDTVGDPFKDTAGPAINPLIKVMNLVSVLIAPAIVGWSVGAEASTGLRVSIAVVALVLIVVAVVISKRRG